VGADRHEAARRGLRTTSTLKRKFDGPPKGSPWVWFPRELVISPAFWAATGNAKNVVFRILEEHMAQGGKHNGQLIVTHQQFAQCGVRLASVAQAIREAEFLGLIAVDRGYAYRGGHEPNIYRITWIGNFKDEPPTNEWRGIGTAQISVWRERLAMDQAQKRSRKAAKRNLQGGNIVPLRA
jgi:hypothetical protein